MLVCQEEVAYDRDIRQRHALADEEGSRLQVSIQHGQCLLDILLGPLCVLGKTKLVVRNNQVQSTYSVLHQVCVWLQTVCDIVGE